MRSVTSFSWLLHSIRLATIVVVLAGALGGGPAAAQEAGPIYIVQPGDSLSSIAARFGVTLEQLMEANDISDPDFLGAGQRLVIPGLEGITGTLDTQYINFGDSYRSLLRRTQIRESLLRRLNRLVSPTEFYVGASMIVPSTEAEDSLAGRATPAVGESLLEIAVRGNSDVWSMTSLNKLPGSWAALPGDVLYGAGVSEGGRVSGLPSAFQDVEIRDLPLKQGGTAVIFVTAATDVKLGGILVDHPLQFDSVDGGREVALQGIHALLEPGVYPLRLEAGLPDGAQQSFEQMVVIVSGNYPPEVIPVNDPATIDPDVSAAELEKVLEIVGQHSSPRSWSSTFALPVAPPGLGCIKDWFGRPRTYTAAGSELQLSGFHAGVDFGICSESNPFDIYAPAPGAVVFAGPLPVCGNATLIDHGWGVYSRMCHQDELAVTSGQHVQTGELIGFIGATGRVTGPHLHWEVWVNGVQVEPLDWLDQAYP